MNEIRKQTKFKKLSKRYAVHEEFIIAKSARKTLRYIERNTSSFPNEYRVLKERIINTCYNMLEDIYRANIKQELIYKKEVVVSIEMLNFYLEEALRKGLLSNRKFESYGNHLLELDKMVRAWFNYEAS